MVSPGLGARHPLLLALGLRGSGAELRIATAMGAQGPHMSTLLTFQGPWWQWGWVSQVSLQLCKQPCHPQR